MSDDALRACDLCHSRKVRCDRQLNCANCLDVGLECQRTRPRRPTRPPATTISTLGERLLRLESAISHPHETTESTSPSHSVNQGEEDRGLKRRRLDVVSHLQNASKSPHSSCTVVTPDESTHHAEQAKAVFQGELEGNESMNLERQSILRSALDFVSAMTQGRVSNLEEGVQSEVRDDSPIVTEFTAPPPEIFYMLFKEPPAAAGALNIQWPDHISQECLERMIAVLINGESQGQIFYQYCVCIYVKALFYLSQMPRVYKNSTINQQFLKSKRLYESYALHALKNLSFLSNPTLPFIQSLISAAFLMQYTGNMSQAWIMNSYAARQIVALKYHETRSPVSRSDPNEDIQSSLYWCYYLDRTLSALLLRPLSLPEPLISPADLIVPNKSQPHLPLIRILMELAQVQGDLLSCGKADSTRQILANHSKLQERMDVIKSSLQATRESVNEFLSCDWISGEFCYYAILVDILRSRLKYSFSPLTHKECVACARKSLKALRYLQKNPGKSPGFADPYPTFLTWTMFLYPLSPFFVLFCNIIGELDFDDYTLIQDITQSLTPFAASPYISKLLKLLESLQNFCIPLIEAKQRLGPKSKVAPWYPSMTGALPETSTTIEPSFPVDSGSSYANPVAPVLPQQVQSHGDQAYPPTDELMWHLWNSQLSMECFESDFIGLDPSNGNGNF
ncbi:transcriptional regulator family: Fungal Specific TF [Penicillium waksmanii]|uniref:transcriptional regulator family: Fungal Specific TF n=1 Tax=Penicillium waksmanii TaxID=69791 RepID=UPI002547E08F|nr:transcriptional regulator family: Fungal Specific TF [Penicillium waksmanii]KAJ5983496.1 transcriptional regulator family: Fungal Specific TF [Penicillium waksmanii]